MKIGQKMMFDDQENKLIIQTRHDHEPVLNLASDLRSANLLGMGNESKLVGVIPTDQFFAWAKKHGVDPTDTQAMQEIVAKEMMSGDNSKLRVWGGTF